MSHQKPEIAYLVQNILPVLNSQYDFPSPEDEERTKIGEIPVRIGSSIKKPDIVYYWEGVPVFLIEAKREGKSEEDAVDQALSYVRNYPSKYTKDGIKPRLFAVTIGSKINFYIHRYQIGERNELLDWAEKIEIPLVFGKILQEYGLKRVEKRRMLSADSLQKEFLYELAAIYAFDNKITPEVVKNVSRQIFSYLELGDGYVSRQPYVSLDNYRDRQTRIRQLFNNFDIFGSLGPHIAREYRRFVLRAFQGGGFSQFMTEQCIIDFMWDLVGKVNPKSRVLDFECGSGGFLGAAITRNKLPLKNILGIDIDELPYTAAKTFIALHFKGEIRKSTESVIRLDNGLYDYGKDWDVVISNPAGGNIYKHGNEERILKEGLQNLTGKKHNFSEYELSIQQAIRSAKVGGEICLILPEGFFSNSYDSFLRKFVAKYCKVLAVVSLPRGVFRVGTSVKGRGGGSHIGQMKMSILYAEKAKEIEPNVNLDQESGKWAYPIFIARISNPQNATENICDWLEKEFDLVLSQWKLWGKK